MGAVASAAAAAAATAASPGILRHPSACRRRGAQERHCERLAGGVGLLLLAVRLGPMRLRKRPQIRLMAALADAWAVAQQGLKLERAIESAPAPGWEVSFLSGRGMTQQAPRLTPTRMHTTRTACVHPHQLKHCVHAPSSMQGHTQLMDTPSRR